MSQDQSEQQRIATEVLTHLRQDYHTASLATVSPLGHPQVSYVPLALEGTAGLLFFVSELSEHTENLRTSGRASLMLIEDEAKSSQLFARNRVTFNGPVRLIERQGPEWEQAATIYGERFGKFFHMLATLKDFHMFRLVPQDIRLVVGFGSAYRVEGANWEKLTLFTGR